jgi:hypothetical protein
MVPTLLRVTFQPDNLGDVRLESLTHEEITTSVLKNSIKRYQELIMITKTYDLIL